MTTSNRRTRAQRARERKNMQYLLFAVVVLSLRANYNNIIRKLLQPAFEG